MEQTKEARFLPSLVQDRVQIGIIFSNNNLIKGDILDPNNISDDDVKDFVNESYYKDFIILRKKRMTSSPIEKEQYYLVYRLILLKGYWSVVIMRIIKIS